MAIYSLCRIVSVGPKEAGGLNDRYRRQTVLGRRTIGRGRHGGVRTGESFQGKRLHPDGNRGLRVRRGRARRGLPFPAAAPNYNGGPNTTRVSFFLPYFANNFTLPTGTLVGTTFKQVNATGLGQSATGYKAQARIPAMTPAAPAPATVFVTATVDINGFDSDAPTCNVRLYFQGQRFPF